MCEEKKMNNTYVIVKENLNESPASAVWPNVEPLYIRNYMWMNNGYMPEASVKLFYTDEHLHLLYRVYEDNPTISYFHRNKPVYKDSCVEFFFQPLPEEDPRYLNFEFNAAGTLLLGLGEGRSGRVSPEYPNCNFFSIRTSNGHDNPGIKGEGYWELEFSIPFAWLQSIFPAFNPVAAKNLRGNFYKCGDETPFPHYGCWNLVTSPNPDFHRSMDFGDLILG
jgi:hypothetical protein